MTKFLLGSAALVVFFANQATAADLPTKAPVYKAPIVDWWTGGYLGVNVGYSWGDWESHSNQKVFNFESFNASPKVNGVVGGVQVGYNWRVGGQWLWGVEADLQATGERERQTWTDPGLQPPPVLNDFVPRCCGPAALSHKWDFPWFGTLRLRAGITPSPQWLLYATGGLAVGESKYSFNFSQPGAAPAPTNFALSSSDTRVGFAVGAGTEYKLDPSWSVKLEYLYVDLGKASIDTHDIDGFPFHVDYRVRDHILRAGLNWRFGGPVVARY